LRITIDIEGEEVTIKVTPSPLPAEGQTTLADFTTDGDDEPSRHPTLEGGAQFFNHIPVRPNADAKGGVIADNHGNRGYARGGIPNSCSRCGQVHRRCCDRINDPRSVVAWSCLTCMGWEDDSDELDGHRFTTGYFHHPLWPEQYARLLNGA
jgi:hypothetical protein